MTVIAEFSHFDERHAVGGLPRPQEIREFIRLWTLKEAYSKMLGLGHALDFKMIKFTLDPVDLKSAGERQKQIASTQFENFYVSSHHALFHASLAIRHRAGIERIDATCRSSAWRTRKAGTRRTPTPLV